MKKPLLLSVSIQIVLLFVAMSCFAQKKSESPKERELEREKREQQEHRKHRKKGVPDKVERTNKYAGNEEEDEGNERYDGIVAAQQREFDMTHDPATNTVPKERLINALQMRNASIAKQNQANLIRTNGISTNGTITPYGTTTTVNATSWLERGPYKDYPGPYGNSRDSTASTSGRIVALWADTDPTKPNQVFVGGIDGGLWSCPDITASAPAWTAIDNFSNLAISSICQDPTNPSIMYFGTGEHTVNSDAVRGGGVWKSTDHGQTWNILPNTVTFYNISKVLCDKNGFVYVATTYSYGIGTGAGLQRSKNGGTSWSDITPTISSLTTRQVGDMVYDPINNKMGVYMGYYPSSTAIVTGFCYAQPDTVNAGTWSTDTASTGAGGGMMIKVNTSSTALYQTILTVKNGVFWALRSNYGTVGLYLYRSLDGGVTWTQPGAALTSTIYGAGQGWYSIGLDCDPTSPAANVIIGGLNVFKSVDSGKTFIQKSEWVTGANTGAPAQYVHADVHNIAYNTTTAGINRVIVCSDGGIFYSNNGGSNWADRNVGLRLKQFYSCAINPSVPDYFLAGAQDNGSHQFTQPGLGQSTEVNGGDGAFVTIDQSNPTNQITSYTYNSYHVSKDAGKTWSSNTFGSSVGAFINPFDFDSKTKKMYTAYTTGNYLRWDDPTTTQTSTSVVSVSSVIGIVVPTAVTVSANLANTIYIGGGSKVAKVVNANTSTPTVTDITPPTLTSGSISSIVVGPSTTDQDMMVTVSSYGAKKVFITANGGGTWTEITGNLPDMPVRWALFYPGGNTQAFLATEAGVWFTTAINGASTVWQASAGFPAVRSDMIKYSATNGVIAVATHGRGLWTTKYSTIPKVSFYATILNSSKSVGATTTGCRTYTDYSDTIQISDAPTGDATATISVQAGSTAKQGADFDFTTNGSFTSPSATAVFANGVFPAKVPITVRVYNNHDKNAVLPQTANLVYTLSGTTDATVSTANQSLALSLTDVFPNSTTLLAQTLWSENWETWPATSSSWTFVPEAYYGSPVNANALIPLGNYGCAGPISNITAQLFGTNSSGGLAYCANGNSGAYTARMARAVTAASNHYGNMKVTFSYKSNGNNTTITNSLVHSLDNGTTWIIDTSYTSSGSSSTVLSTSFSFPASLNGTNFILGWQSVGTAAQAYNINGWEIDNIVVTGDIAAPPIDSTLSSAGTNNETSGQSIDFYSANSNVFANIANPSADLGCVTASIEAAGSTWQTYRNGTRSQKIFLITPTTNGSAATYNATLYFTNAELGGLDPTTLRIAKTSASSVSTADGSNTVLITPTTATYNTYGTAFTGSFSGFSRFFLVDNSVVLPITLVDFKASLIDGNAELTWITSSENNNHQFDVEVSMDGINFVKLGTVLSKGNSITNVTYNYTHVKPAAGIYYYRLKQIDNDGRFVYSKTVAININNGSVAKAFVYPVPASKFITINFGTIVQQATINMYSNDLKLLRTEIVGQSTVTKDLDISQLPAGVYILHITTANQTETLKFVKE